MDAHEPRMVEPAQQPDLALASLEIGNGVVVGAEHLHRDIAAEFGVTRPIDVGHPPGPMRSRKS